MNTSEKLRALLADGWTQTGISRVTGIPQGTVSRMAAGNDPRESNARLIDEFYDRVTSEKDAA